MKLHRLDHCPMCGATCPSDGCDEPIFHCPSCGDVVLDEHRGPVVLASGAKPVWLRVFDVVAFVVITILFGWLTFLAGGTASGLDGYILGVAVTALTLHATGWRPR